MVPGRGRPAQRGLRVLRRGSVSVRSVAAFPQCQLHVPRGFSELIQQVQPPCATFPHPKRGFALVTVAKSWLLQPRAQGSVPVPACPRGPRLFAVACSFFTSTGDTVPCLSTGDLSFLCPAQRRVPLPAPQLPPQLLSQLELDPGFYPQGTVTLGSVLKLAGPGVVLREKLPFGDKGKRKVLIPRPGSRGVAGTRCPSSAGSEGKGVDLCGDGTTTRSRRRRSRGPPATLHGASPSPFLLLLQQMPKATRETPAARQLPFLLAKGYSPQTLHASC